MSTQQALQGKHAFITGGSGGIGSAIAESLVNDGAAVTLMARDSLPLDAPQKPGWKV